MSVVNFERVEAMTLADLLDYISNFGGVSYVQYEMSSFWFKPERGEERNLSSNRVGIEAMIKKCLDWREKHGNAPALDTPLYAEVSCNEDLVKIILKDKPPRSSNPYFPYTPVREKWEKDYDTCVWL